MVASVAQTSNKPQAFFVQLGAQHGILTKPGRQVIFVDADTHAVTPITPANALQVIVLRDVAAHLADGYADQRSGYAGVRAFPRA